RLAAISYMLFWLDKNGRTWLIKATGSSDSHIVLRGGREGSNYEPHQTAAAVELLRRAGLPLAIMVDCSHSNSGKDPHRQPLVWENVLEQRAAGRKDIIGMMLESNLYSGSQA